MRSFGFGKIFAGDAKCPHRFDFFQRRAKPFGLSNSNSLKKTESYFVSTKIDGAHTNYFVGGADAIGAMYGGLDIAEAIKLGALDQLKTGEHAPFIARRNKPEREIPYERADRNFAGDCCYLTQRHFVDRLLDGKPFETSGEDYLRTLAVQEAVYQSAETGQSVEVKPL